MATLTRDEQLAGSVLSTLVLARAHGTLRRSVSKDAGALERLNRANAVETMRARATWAARRIVAARLSALRTAHTSANGDRPERGTSRERRPARRRRTSRALRSRDGPDEPEPRTCEVCGESLAGKNSNAKTCSSRCRVAKHRQTARERLAPDPELLGRWDRACSELEEIARLGPLDPDWLLDILAIVLDGEVYDRHGRPQVAA